jgi:hypothetical protein
MFYYTRVIGKVTSGALLTKQAMRKKTLHTKNTYILKLLLNIVIAGIETLVSGNKFLYDCVKEVCHLWTKTCFILRNTKKNCVGLFRTKAWNADIRCCAPHDDARPHTAARNRALLEHFNFELSDYPPYRPVLAPGDYNLCTYLKNWLGSQRFSNNEELMEGVKTWLSSQAADFFDTGIQKLFPRYKKCINSGNDHVEE